MLENYKALDLAREKGLDLVEIDPNSRPPIAKIMDFGKYKYDLAKKEKEQKSRQKESELKEVRLTLKIGDHDLSYKAKNAKDFFNRGNKVKVVMRLKGRENVFFSNALEVFKRFSKHSGLVFESQPKRMGNLIIAQVSGEAKDSEDNISN